MNRYTVTTFLILQFCAIGGAFGQFSSARYIENEDGTRTPSATDLLTPKETDGRFGKMQRGGWISPSPGQNARIGGNAIFTSSGAFVGTDTNTPNSRFQSWWREPEYRGGLNYASYSEYLKAKRSGDLEPASLPNLPGQLQARRDETPTSIPRATASYYDSQFQRDFGLVSARPEGTNVEPIRQQDATRQSWMRGAANTPASPSPGSPAPAPRGPQTTRPVAPAAGSTPPNIAPNIAPNETALRNEPVLSPEQSAELERLRQEQTARVSAREQELLREMAARNAAGSLEKQLEGMLLRNPNVNPLSPIQVQYHNGVATVRGVVPSQVNRVEAGRVLLSDPRVKTVDNKLSVLPTKSDAPLPKTFDPALEGRTQGQ